MQPKFSPGELVHHLKYEYRGVVVDVDPEYTGSEAWYEQVAVSQPPKDRPWYRVLVDGAEHMTYVAEQHLAQDPSGEQIEHPELGRYFQRFDGDRYFLRTH